jgi:hypothetical protein
MHRKRYLPPSPLAPRQVVNFDVRDPEHARAALSYWKRRLAGLARDRSEFPSEFDRLIADTEAWCQDVAAAAGLRPDQAVSDELYPEPIWYAARISTRAAEIRHLRDRVSAARLRSAGSAPRQSITRADGRKDK